MTFLTAKPFVVDVNKSSDIVEARRVARQMCVDLGLGITDQTRFATAVSELTRNAIQYANGSVCTIEDVSTDAHIKVKVTVLDNGPGIPDINVVLQDGYSTGGGLGAGLPGTKRLLQDFFIESINGATSVGGTLCRKR